MPDWDAIYVRNPKAACSTIVLWLHRMYTGDHDWSPESVHLQHHLPRPGVVGWQQVGRMLDREAFRFTFVRDPVGRAESAYLDKIVRQPLLRGEVQRVLGQPEDPNAIPTFNEYVDALEQSDPLTMDPHWRPQHLNLMHPLVSYDLIGRLETFDADMARLRDATGMPAVPLEDVNRRPREASLFDGRPALRERVAAVYARDLELYSY